MRLVTIALLLLCGLAPAARALTVVVPTDHPTISAALASGADEILVANGDYSGSITINRPVTLRAQPSSGSAAWSSAPVILGNVTFLDGASSGTARLQGFRIFGDVLLQTSFAPFPSLDVLITESRVSGRVHRGTFTGQNALFAMRGCIVDRGIDVAPYSSQFAFVAVLDGGMVTNFEGDLSVMHNEVQVITPGSPGIKVPVADFGGLVQDNSVTGALDGISVDNPSGLTVRFNALTDCTQDGIVVTGGGTSTITSNTVTRSGRHGISTDGIHTVGSNAIFNAAQKGIVATGAAQIQTNRVMDARGEGIHAVSGGALVRQNVVLRAGANGILANSVSQIERNHVGRSTLDGIRATGNPPVTFKENTSYLNGNHGYRDLTTGSSPFANNIAYGNSQFGLLRSGGASAMACNDWFGNLSGSTSGVAPGTTDRFVDPLFCGLPSDIVTLATGSPLVGTACGQIGAYGIGCAATTGVDEMRALAAPLMQLGPNPSSGDVRFTWKHSDAEVDLEVYDLRGARVWTRRFDTGQRTHVWNGRDAADRAVAPGVYMARIRTSEGMQQERIVRVK